MTKPLNTKVGHLGNLTPDNFLKKYWQKTPLLIRNAFRGYSLDISLEQIIDFSSNPACATRLIVREEQDFKVHYGPVTKPILKTLPAEGWTILVQGVNYVHDGARRLLDMFKFIPYARQDDIMVSYAAPGGGVGPHYDSYDVFLLQGNGSRCWEVSRPKNMSLKPDHDLKILESFEPDGRCVMQKGDMLYVPPEFCHNGISDTECITYSIGFRAPSYNELKVALLDYLDEEFDLSGFYSDPNLRPTKLPAEIPSGLIDSVTSVIKKLKTKKKDSALLLGKFLTRTNNQGTLDTTIKSISDFKESFKNNYYELTPSAKLLYFENYIFLNGEAYIIDSKSVSALREIANSKRVSSIKNLNSDTVELLYSWASDGLIRKNRK